MDEEVAVENFNDGKHQVPDEPRLPHELELDIRCAASIDTPVLVTAADDLATSVAELIHRRSGRQGRPLLVFRVEGSVADAEALSSCLAEHVDQRPTLLLTDVSSLDAKAQAFLERWLAEQSERVTPSVRVIAATRVWLHDLVELGTFDEELFYRLNKIHLDLMHRAVRGPSDGEKPGRYSGAAGGCDLLSHPAERPQ